MIVGILRFDEFDNEYHESEIPMDNLKDNDHFHGSSMNNDNILFLLLSNRCIFGSEEGKKPIEFYVKIYKD